MFVVEHSFARELAGLYEPTVPAGSPDPRLLVVNHALVNELGLEIDAVTSPDGVSLLAGNAVPDEAELIAQAYSGHQFGGFSPRLGDGRALLLGEIVDPRGHRHDLHLKGSGRTPFSRGGDGKAAVGPMLREYVIGEAMHRLCIPTTRALAVVATGERIARDEMLPGAILARIATSHLRVGTFQFAALTGDSDLLRRLADYAAERHYPTLLADSHANRYLGLLREVVLRQAALVASWMHVGFIHGVMNTDNMTISGETIDYGPCAFMDHYHPARVFSSIDHDGRYAYGNQPQIAQWNLTRLAESLLPLIDSDQGAAVAAATAVLREFSPAYQSAWLNGMRAKLGWSIPSNAADLGGDIDRVDAADTALIGRFLQLLQEQRVDFTLAFRSLSAVLRGDRATATALFSSADRFAEWAEEWHARLSMGRVGEATVAEAMDGVNPLYIARNHIVEAALRSASDQSDLAPLRRLVEVLSHPYETKPELEEFAQPAPLDSRPYRTFCGT